MSRLLHAAARGARIQAYPHLGGGFQWAEITRIPLPIPEYYRIHPEEAHLQCGPISSALREMAKNPKAGEYVFPHLPPYFGFGVEHQTQDEADSLKASDEFTHSFFFLLLAEALADEGL